MTDINFPSVSIVIPIYNEERILKFAVEHIVNTLVQNFPFNWEIILAENGSKDKTREIAQNLTTIHPQVKLLVVPEPNYGRALKEGILSSTCEYVIGDEIDIGNFEFYFTALAILTKGEADLVIGSKRLAGANDQRPWLRRVATNVMTTLLRIMFSFKGTDTHGLKAMRRVTIEPVIKNCVTDKDLFASELVIRAERAGIKTREIPIIIQEKRQTPIKLFKRVPNVLKNLVRLWLIIHRS